jgi:hypothetical protein
MILSRVARVSQAFASASSSETISMSCNADPLSHLVLSARLQNKVTYMPPGRICLIVATSVPGSPPLLSLTRSPTLKVRRIIGLVSTPFPRSNLCSNSIHVRASRAHFGLRGVMFI